MYEEKINPSWIKVNLSKHYGAVVSLFSTYVVFGFP